MKYFLALLFSFSLVSTTFALRVDPRQMTNTGEFVPRSCEVWNDGCNDCKKTDQGYICPPRTCVNDRMGYCRVQKDTASIPPTMPPQPNPGRPNDCQRWFDGCNTCFYRADGLSSCTRMACQTYDEPRCLDEPEPVVKPRVPNRNPEIPLNCQSWFDGCNGCGVQDGQLTFCTERACAPDQYTEPYCTAFKPEPNVTRDTEILEVEVAAKMVDCNAFRRTCLLVDGKPFSGWIDGFEFEPGFNYELSIEKKRLPQELLDVGPYVYTLLDVISKQPASENPLENRIPPIPENCETWFDGCNNCVVENQKAIGCTQKMCQSNLSEPRCLKFKSNPVVPSTPDDNYYQVPSEPIIEDSVILNFTVAPLKVDCVGVGPMQCLVVNGEYFYDSIEGFAFEPGFEYELKVERTERFPNGRVPADASKYKYTLQSVVSKNLVDTPSSDPQNPVDEPPVLTTPNRFYAPEGCVSWFDGCNSCSVDENGVIQACTERACDSDQLEEPYCKAYAELEREAASKSPVKQSAKEETSYPLVEPLHPNLWGFLKYHLFGWMK